MTAAEDQPVTKVAEKMAAAFDKSYRWVCATCGHVGDQAQKKKHTEKRTGVCEECGGPTELLHVTVSGKKRRPHSLKKFEPRDEKEGEGPDLPLEPLPDGIDLGERFVAELERGGRPTLTFPKSRGLSPLLAGHIYEIGEVDVYVTNVRDTGSELTIDYTTPRDDQSVREDAPLVKPEANPERKPTHQSGWVDESSGEEHLPSPEAERLTQQEYAKLMRPQLEARLKKEKTREEKADALATELEKDYSQNITASARKAVQSLTRIREATEEDIRNLSRHRREKKR